LESRSLQKGEVESVLKEIIFFSPNYYSLTMHKMKHKSIYQSIKYKYKTMKALNTRDTSIYGGKTSPGKKTTCWYYTAQIFYYFKQFFT